MSAAIIDFLDLVLCGLLVGAMWGAWLMLRPARLDAPTYVLVQQNAIRALNDILPALGALTILITLAASLAREDRTRRIILIVAGASLAAAGIITRFSNQPINAIVMTWASDSPPADWTLLRDRWWYWHVVRLAFALTAFFLIIGAVLRAGA